ncbi:hypothetical protein D3C87_1222240 [compost metagenome]
MLNDPLYYNMELTSFLRKNDDKSEKDFIIQEREKNIKYLELVMDRTDTDIRKEIEEECKKKDLTREHVEYLITSEIYKKERAIGRIRKELLSLKIAEGRLPKSQTQETEEVEINSTTATDKIILFEELGLIDFLKKKTKLGISNNKLSEVLSLLTGEKPQTLRPLLNRLSDKDVSDKNHPYHSEKTVSKIKKFLINHGF